MYDEEGGISVPIRRFFVVFVGQGVRLGKMFGVVHRVYENGTALVYFADGEIIVPLNELERPIPYGAEGLKGDDRTSFKYATGTEESHSEELIATVAD